MLSDINNNFITDPKYDIKAWFICRISVKYNADKVNARN